MIRYPSKAWPLFCCDPELRGSAASLGLETSPAFFLARSGAKQEENPEGDGARHADPARRVDAGARVQAAAHVAEATYGLDPAAAPD